MHIHISLHKHHISNYCGKELTFHQKNDTNQCTLVQANDRRHLLLTAMLGRILWLASTMKLRLWCVSWFVVVAQFLVVFDRDAIFRKIIIVFILLHYYAYWHHTGSKIQSRSKTLSTKKLL